MKADRMLAVGGLIVGGCALSTAWQQNNQLTARELFYAEKASAATQAQGKRSEPNRAPKKVASSKPSTPPVEKAVKQGERRAPSTPASGSSFVLASYTGGKPLGLRYSLLRDVDGEYREVDTDTVFRSGDRIRVSAESNDAAYLYVVMKGTSGTWKVLFPSPEIAGGSNRVEIGSPRVIPPPPGRFAFSGDPGDERLFIVLSRKPEESLEQLIYSLTAGRPAAEEKQPKVMLLAQGMRPIDDSLVARLRSGVFARDLVFEKVDEATPGERKEKAAYVVNSTGNPDSRLVADLTLKHR